MRPAPTALSSHCAGSTPGRGTANAVIASDPTELPTMIRPTQFRAAPTRRYRDSLHGRRGCGVSGDEQWSTRGSGDQPNASFGRRRTSAPRTGRASPTPALAPCNCLARSARHRARDPSRPLARLGPRARHARVALPRTDDRPLRSCAVSRRVRHGHARLAAVPSRRRKDHRLRRVRVPASSTSCGSAPP